MNPIVAIGARLLCFSITALSIPEGLSARTSCTPSLAVSGFRLQGKAPSEKPALLRLAVRSKATGEHLEHVTVLTKGQNSFGLNRRGWLKDPFNNYRDYVLIEGGESPVELSPRSRDVNASSTTYFVHSPGYAWKSIQVYAQHGGDREIRLERGGRLRVDLVGDTVGESAQLYVRRESPDGDSTVAQLWGRGTRSFYLDGVPLGAYRVSLESDHGGSLGTTDVSVHKRKLASCELRVVAPSNGRFVTARLAGTLVIPLAWNVDSFDLCHQKTAPRPRSWSWSSWGNEAQVNLIDDASGTWEFDFDRLGVGTYKIMLGGDDAVAEYTWDVVLGPEGALGLEWALPPPADVSIRLVDSDGQPASGVENLHWSACRSIEPFENWESCESGDSTFTFRAPIGNIALSTLEGEYLRLEKKVEVHSGMNEFTWTLDQTCRFTLHLFDGETPVPPPFLIEYEMINAGERATMHTMEAFGTPFIGRLAKPGRYALQLGAIEGFLRVPPQIITVEVGGVTKHRVQLVRDDG